MAGSDSSLFSKVSRKVIKRVVSILRNQVIVGDYGDMYVYDLEVADELCRGRMIRMSPQLITMLNIFYRKCQSNSHDARHTPVMSASIHGYADLVWGFIQCSKETYTDLHTQSVGDPWDFIWLQNRNGKTALDMAISDERVEVAKVLLSEATRDNLESAWKTNGAKLFPLLDELPIHDGFIFDKLEESKVNDEAIYQPTRKSFYDKVDKHAYLMKIDGDILKLINPNTNNYFHTVSKFGDVVLVNYVLENQPSLISSHNPEGETPVYVAAKEGHADVLQIMFKHLKENNGDIEWQLLLRPKDKHNALHIAIQNHHAQVVFLLLEKVPQLANSENIFKESPLYLAAERSYFGIVKLILNKCGDKSFKGPNGKTALHAAAISNSAECIKHLLQVKPDLVNVEDENGWTPWRYAVHYNSGLAMKEMLAVNHSIGFQFVTQDDTVTSLLHIAASRGHCEIMKVLLRMCLGSRDFDSKGRNILHVAIENKQKEVIEFIFQDKSFTSLINQKDNNGNTPAHLLAAWDIELMLKVIDSRVNIHSLNYENRTPLDMITSDENRERLIKAIGMRTNMSNARSSPSLNIRMNDLFEKEKGKQKKVEAHFKMMDNLVLVVTLIATATFAAAFTVPGGFDSDDGSKQGTPYLLRKAAFQAFVITNAMAFSCSFSVLLGHIVLLIHRNRNDEASHAEQKYIDDKIVIMYILTGVALVAMLIAIVTGLYVVLLPSLWLSVFVCAFSIGIVVVSLIV